MMKAKKILVTGATGYIGSRLVRTLLTQQHSVTVLARDLKKAKKLFGNLVSYHIADLGAQNAFKDLPANFECRFISIANQRNVLHRK
jgi:uncharacterized protein YbjT (DUF2867 family)